MKGTSGLMALGALALLQVLPGPAPAAAAEPDGVVVVAEGTVPADLPPPVRPMTDLEKAGAGCVISSVATMGVVYALGPSEFVMNVVGGLIVPSSSPVLFVGLMSTIASMACGAGAAFTPAVMWGLRQLGQGSQEHGAAASDPVPGRSAPPDTGITRALASAGGGGMVTADAPKAVQ